MNASERELLIETLDRVFAAGADWESIEEIGVTALLVPEAAGGLGGAHYDAALVAHRVALHTVALPVCETVLARRLLAQMSVEVSAGAASFCSSATGSLAAGTYTGSLREIPWGRDVQHVLAQVEDAGRTQLVCLATADASKHTLESNIAGEPRDTLEFRNSPVVAHAPLEPGSALINLGALMRTAQIGGALESLLRQCVSHASGRSQFGKALSQFQVIQHQIALLAEESAAVNCAALAAARAADLGDAEFEIAAAKLRANRAIGIATSIAHQIHGAIGCTHEHALHRATQRLWSWRSEFGNDRYWALQLGEGIAHAGADAFWPQLTARGDRRA
jgi:acyl-CoA dehydrogenase